MQFPNFDHVSEVYAHTTYVWCEYIVFGVAANGWIGYSSSSSATCFPSNILLFFSFFFLLVIIVVLFVGCSPLLFMLFPMRWKWTQHTQLRRIFFFLVFFSRVRSTIPFEQQQQQQNVNQDSVHQTGLYFDKCCGCGRSV